VPFARGRALWRHEILVVEQRRFAPSRIDPEEGLSGRRCRTAVRRPADLPDAVVSDWKFRRSVVSFCKLMASPGRKRDRPRRTEQEPSDRLERCSRVTILPLQ
jgi:hypothetical protein